MKLLSLCASYVSKGVDPKSKKEKRGGEGASWKMRIETEESKEDTLPKSIPVSQVSHITLSVFNMIMNNIILISILLSVSLLTNVISYHSVPVNINHLKTRTASASSTSLLFRSPEQRKHNVLVAHQQALKEANAYHTLPLFLSGNNLIESKIVDLQDKVQDEGLGAWLPFASISSLRGLGPQRVTIMNIDFVVWHSPDPSKDGNDKKERKMKKEEKKEPLTWTVQADACTHRLAPLSQGRVDPQSDCIECPYHGWQFDSTGNVTNIPQLDDGVNIEDVRRKPGVNLKTFPTHVVGDLLFVFLPSSLHGEMFPQSLLPEEYYPFLNKYKNRTNLTFFARDLPYSFDFLVEVSITFLIEAILNALVLAGSLRMNLNDGFIIINRTSWIQHIFLLPTINYSQQGMMGVLLIWKYW